MNLKNQYKRLFEARVSSNDAKLLREGTWALQFNESESYSSPEISNYGKSKLNFSWLDDNVVVSNNIDTIVYYDPVKMDYDWLEDLASGDKRDIMNDIKKFIKDYPIPNSKRLDSNIHIITKDFRGDLTKWPKGSLIYVMDSEEGKDYKFIKFVNPQYSDNYDDIEVSILNSVTEPFDSKKHKRAAELLKKWKKS